VQEKKTGMSDKLTLIIFSDNLDKTLAAFNIATGAASMGMEVSMFFTFWGLNILRKKKEVSKPKNLGINIIACNTTMEIMGIKREDLIPEVNEIAGVATYLSKARDSKINLFI